MKMTAPRKALVLGGTGMLGRPLLSQLQERGCDVICVSSQCVPNMHPALQAFLKHVGAEHKQLDLALDLAENGLSELEAIVQETNVDVVVNCVADRGGITWDGRAKRMNDELLNEQLPAALAELAACLQFRFVHISTEYVWSGEDNTPNGYPAASVDQDLRFAAGGAAYARQKLRAEAFLTGNRWVTIVRLPVLYGPMCGPLEDGTCGASIANLLGENTWAHDTWQRRYPTSAGDAAAAVAALTKKLLRGRLERQVYHYGSQACVTKYEFMQLFCDTLGIPHDRIAPCDAGQKAPGSRPPYDVKLDISETRSELLAVGDWHEPRALDKSVIARVWLPHFASEVQKLFGVCGQLLARDEIEVDA